MNMSDDRQEQQQKRKKRKYTRLSYNTGAKQRGNEWTVVDLLPKGLFHSLTLGVWPLTFPQKTKRCIRAATRREADAENCV